MKTSKTIKEMDKLERPREKLARYGAEFLSNTELLAILLKTGKKGENVLEMAGKMLKFFGSGKLPDAKLSDLEKYSGLGPAKASEIIACFELGKRLLKNKKARIYLSPRDVWQALSDIRSLKKEYFIVFFLDARNQEIKREVISVGTIDTSLVHPREVFEPAIRNLASQIIVAHNHPSDNCEPSREDRETKKRLIDAGKILGIDVLDFVIVSKNNFKSLK